MIFERLREERERLKLTQPVFAELAGVKKRTVIDWEKGISSPTAVQLSALSSAGVDVLYVITGQRSSPAIPIAMSLSPRQQALLDNYEATSDEGRRIIEATASAAAQPQSLARRRA